MKNIIHYLSFIAVLGIFTFAQAQEIENPQEELVKTWYLTKLVIEDVDYPFIPDGSLQDVVLDFEANSSDSENISGYLYSNFCEDAGAGYLLESDEEFYTSDWAYMTVTANSSNCDHETTNEPQVDYYNYFTLFWAHPDLEEPYHYTYTIQQSEEDLQKLVVINDKGIEAHFQNAPYMSMNDYQQDNWLVYPNPVKDFLYFENNIENSSLEIYDLSGKKLLQQKIQFSTQRVDLSLLSQGIYFYAISQDGKRVKMGKLVKE